MFETSTILLRRKNKINLPPCPSPVEAGPTEKAMVMSIVKNIEAMGFTFSRDLFETLLTYPKEEIEAFYADLFPKLKALAGADKEYSPMYPDFPHQVAEADEAELFMNAIIHYWTFGAWMPEYENSERMPLFEDVSLTVLDVGTEEDILDIFKNLVSSKTSLSVQDKEDVAEIISLCPNFYSALPEEIPLKENVALIGKLILDKAAVKNADAVQKYFKTATDVLRLITALSDGDLSLAGKTKYRSLRRCERRMVMDLLAGCGSILEDLYRYHNEWIRVGEIVHPFEFRQDKYKKVNDAFRTLRNEKKPKFFAAQVEELFARGWVRPALTLLQDRPGEFARQLDKTLRRVGDADMVLEKFQEVADKVSVPVLLQLRQHFMDRNSDNPIRVFFPKGSLAKATSIPNNLPDISEEVCQKAVAVCEEAIVKQFQEKDSLGHVYVDPGLRGFIVPFSQRSASKANKTFVRGSHIGLSPNAEAVRAFIWWTNTQPKKEGCSRWDVPGRVDIDLSAAIYDEKWHFLEHVSYTRLRSGDMKAYHSGDITNGGDVNGKGVAEFLDFDIQAVAEKGRYVVYQVYSFTGQPFSSLPNCRFGWMERQEVNSGEIFEPSTVTMYSALTSESVVSLPVIFDCVTREFIWCDIALSLDDSRHHIGGNNLESNLRGMTAACYAMTHLSKPNLYDLACLNAKARGEMVDDRNKADIIFSNDTTPPVERIETTDPETGEKRTEEREKKNVPIITAYDVDYVMGQLL